MAALLGEGRSRTSRRSRAHAAAASPPASFWGVEGEIGMTKASSSSSPPCTSCGGYSPYCRNCQRDAPDLVAPLLGAKHSPLLAGDLSTASMAPLEAVDEDSWQGGATLPRAMVRVPSVAKPGDKLVLTRVHQMDSTGACETSDWQCSVLDDQAGMVSEAAACAIPPPVPALAPAAAPPTVDSPRNERQWQERNQFLEWGESLFKQVGLLEEEKAQLQAALSTCQESQSRLQSELERSKRRCTELERLVRQGVAQSGTAAAAADENDDLRKQLSAYAVEIDVLREEREKLTSELTQARDAAHQFSIERDEVAAQLAMGRKDRDSGELTTADLGNSLESCGSLESQPTHSGKHLISAEEFEFLKRHNQELKEEIEQHREAARRQEALRQQCPDEETQAEMQLPRAPTFQDDDCPPDLSAIAAARAHPEELLECIGQLKQALAQLQEEYVEQTRSFKQFVSNVKMQQREAEREMQLARGQFAAHHGDTHRAINQSDALSRKHQTSEEELQQMRGQHDAIQKHNGDLQAQIEDHRTAIDRHEAPQRERNAKRQRRLEKPIEVVILERALNLNIAWEFMSCVQGFVLDKVFENSGPRKPVFESRYVALFPDEMVMKWCKSTGNEKMASDIRRQRGLPALHQQCRDGTIARSHTTLDLREVIRIDFGMCTRGCLLTSVNPWCCFSLYTTKRSFDFVCPGPAEQAEKCVQCWVLSISRLAPWASGAVRTRAHFAAMRGWLKIHAHCQRHDLTVPQAFAEAMHMAAGAQRPQPVLPAYAKPTAVTQPVLPNYARPPALVAPQEDERRELGATEPRSQPHSAATALGQPASGRILAVS